MSFCRDSSVRVKDLKVDDVGVGMWIFGVWIACLMGVRARARVSV